VPLCSLLEGCRARERSPERRIAQERRPSLRHDKPEIAPPRGAPAPWRVEPENRYGFNVLGVWRAGKTNSQWLRCNTNCALRRSMLQCTESGDPQPVGSTAMPFGEGAMKNHCAYCHGKFGLVRHRRAFKSFCSQTCVDRYRTWLRAEVRKRKSWSDCLWSASLNVVPYPGERSSA
jgi:hypothetical protein